MHTPLSLSLSLSLSPSLSVSLSLSFSLSLFLSQVSLATCFVNGAGVECDAAIAAEWCDETHDALAFLSLTNDTSFLT